MPSANTTADYVSYGGLMARASWEQYSISDTQITFRVCGSAQITQAYLYGARVEVSIDQPEGTGRAYQTSSGYSSSNPGANWGSVAESDWAYATFDRAGSASTAYIRARAYGETTSGYGAAFAYIGRIADTGWQTVGTVSIPKLDTPAAHSNVVNTRNSDTQNTLSWTNGANPTDAKTTYIERAVDGSSTFSQITTVKGTVTSYVDKTTSANHSYNYRVRSGWGGIYSGFTTSNTTYNTPIAPGKPTCARNADNSVKVTFTNTAITATATELQRSTDKVVWTAAKTQAGTNVTEIVDTPGGGTFYYRARNTRDTLASAYSAASDAVVTIMPPAAPTLVGPVSGGIVKTSDVSVVFEWTHNPLDGSAQTSAELQYSLNGGVSYTTKSVSGAANTYTLANSFAVNSAVTWRVRTKGADPSFGAYSSTRTFNVYQTPMVAITSPGSSPIATMPIHVAWSYTDLSGTQEMATVEILSVSGQILHSVTVQGVATSVDITSGDYLPANNLSYLIRASVRSTTSLTSSTTIGISTAYAVPTAARASLVTDSQRASVLLSVSEGVFDGVTPTVSLGIMRRRKDGSLLTLADHIPSGSAVTDVYPPLDEVLTYVFFAYAATGVASSVELTASIPSKMAAYINYGDGLRQLAKLALDTNWNKAFTHSKEVFESAGTTAEDAYPLVFYGASKQLSGTLSGTAIRTPELIGNLASHNLISDFDALSQWTGSVVLRLPFEDPIPATVSISQSIDNQYLSGVSVSWERVRAYGLAI